MTSPTWAVGNAARSCEQPSVVIMMLGAGHVEADPG
jgi:hypothetical protein